MWRELLLSWQKNPRLKQTKYHEEQNNRCSGALSPAAPEPPLRGPVGHALKQTETMQSSIVCVASNNDLVLRENLESRRQVV